jgi:hypothetical protein
VVIEYPGEEGQERRGMSSVQSLHRVPLALMNLNQQIFIGTFLNSDRARSED